MASARQKVINGRTFSFGIIPPLDAVLIEVEIARIIGEPLFRAFTAAKGSDEKGDANDQSFSPSEADGFGALAIAKLTANMKPADVRDLVVSVLRHTSCDGIELVNQGVIDSVFGPGPDGRPRHLDLWKVFIEELRENFASFFPENLFVSAAQRLSATLKT